MNAPALRVIDWIGGALILAMVLTVAVLVVRLGRAEHERDAAQRHMLNAVDQVLTTADRDHL